jgi:hypothetical protein
MGSRFFPADIYRPSGVSFPVWAGARLAALVLGAFVVFLLWQMKPPHSPAEPPAIQGVSMARLEPAIPKPAIPTRPLPAARQDQAEIAAQRPVAPPRELPNIKDRAAPPTKAAESQSPTNAPVSAPSTQSNAQPIPAYAGPVSPSIATAPSAQTGSGAGSSATNAPPRLGGATAAILRARECARLDIRERPADCPPNDELKRLLAQERGPQYRPENADGFSRNELAWRGIPPPCLDDGQNAAIKGTKLCVRFGNVPSRVRSVREICEARGLGGCQDAPSQEAVKAALDEVARQKAAKP